MNPKIFELDYHIIAVDVHFKELALTSDNVFYNNINKTTSLRKTEKHLKRLQRLASRKYKKRTPKSNHLLKLEGKIRKQHRRLTNFRTNHVHQATAEIVKSKPSHIVIETLNIRYIMKTSICLRQLQIRNSISSNNACNKYGLHRIAFVQANI